ncbi:MAG: DUF1003 domain-containing protein, partial [Thermomicrobiales bacterium]
HAGLHLPHLPGIHHARNVNELHDRGLSAGERVADGVAALIGSWRFIIVQSVLLIGWICLNVIGAIRHWDPYPFILLNLALSFQAAYSAPIIMMSQNRQAAKDRLQADEDYRVNVLAEHEIARIQAHVEGLVVERWDHLIALQQEQLVLLRAITSTLPMPPPHEEQQPPTA